MVSLQVSGPQLFSICSAHSVCSYTISQGIVSEHFFSILIGSWGLLKTINSILLESVDSNVNMFISLNI